MKVKKKKDGSLKITIEANEVKTFWQYLNFDPDQHMDRYIKNTGYDKQAICMVNYGLWDAVSEAFPEVM